jgi:soluble lytic murein transglycosylase-like protein
MTLPEVLARIEQLLPQRPAPTAAAPAAVATAATPTTTSFADTLARTQSSAPYQAEIDSAARENGLDPDLLSSVIQQESGFDPNATSAAGAQGLMQLMPATAESLGVTDPYDPVQSIDAGARYLRGDLESTGGSVPLALAAYNAGVGAVHEYGGVPPYQETQSYVQEVLDRYRRLSNEERTV